MKPDKIHEVILQLKSDLVCFLFKHRVVWGKGREVLGEQVLTVLSSLPTVVCVTTNVL